MYGNNIFKPGTLVFVDPTRDGALNYSSWRELGLVGFYRIIEIDHQINVGPDPSHETRIRAVWETFGSCDDDDSGLVSAPNALSIGPAARPLDASQAVPHSPLENHLENHA